MDSPLRFDPDALLAESGYVRRLAHALVRGSHANTDADDVAQDVAVAALQQRTAPAHLRGWLAAVARRLSARARRDAGRRARHEANAAPPPHRDEGVHAAERLRLHQRLTSAVLALPEPYRTAVTLRFLDELPPRAIAARLGTTSEVVRQRVARGLALLRERLDGDIGDRDRWLRALAPVAGALPAGPLLLLPVLAMNKLALGAAAVLAAVAVLLLVPGPSAPTVPLAPAEPVAAAPAAAETAAVSAAPRVVDLAGTGRRVAAAGAEELFAVCVVDSNGAPVGDAEVHTWRDGEQGTCEQRTDHEGSCSFPGAKGAGHLLVLAPGRFPFHTGIAARRGEHRIVLPPGAVITGTLLVDGARAGGWALRLLGAPPGLPPGTPRELAQRVQYETCRSVLTTAAGEFAFRGLPDGWRGSLDLPHALWLLPQSGGTPERHDSMPVTVAQGPLVVHTTALTRLCVRVVWSDDGTPVTNASVHAHGVFADGSGTPAMIATGDSEGRLCLGFDTGRHEAYHRWCEPRDRPALASAHVSVTARGADGKADRTLRGDAFHGELVVPLVRAPISCFRVLGADGAPLAGARVWSRSVSAPSDADGRGTFAGRPPEVRAVGAPAHRIGPCAPLHAGAGTFEDPVVYRLQPDNALRVCVVDRTGTPVAGARIALHGAPAFFAGDRIHGDIDRLLRGTDTSGDGETDPGPDGTLVWTEYTCAASADANGELTLHSLEPGRTCTVTVRDAMFAEIARQTVATPPFGETADIELRADATPLRLHGTVVDAEGAPLRGVRIEAIAGRRSTAVTSGDGGVFRFEGLCAADRVELFASHPGHAPLAAGHHATADADPLGLRLARGHCVTLRMVGVDGTPLPLRPELVGGARGIACDDLGGGAVRWRNLPAGEVTFRCRVGDRTFTLAHDSRVAEARFVVPTTAAK